MAKVWALSDMNTVLSKHLPPTVPTTQLSSWSSLKIQASSANNIATSSAASKAVALVGLFGYDMSALNADCAVAYINCAYSDKGKQLKLFDGWAIGVAIKLQAGQNMFRQNLPTDTGVTNGYSAKKYGDKASYGLNVFFGKDQTNLGVGHFNFNAVPAQAATTNYQGYPAIAQSTYYYGFSGNNQGYYANDPLFVGFWSQAKVPVPAPQFLFNGFKSKYYSPAFYYSFYATANTVPWKRPAFTGAFRQNTGQLSKGFYDYGFCIQRNYQGYDFFAYRFQAKNSLYRRDIGQTENIYTVFGYDGTPLSNQVVWASSATIFATLATMFTSTAILV